METDHNFFEGPAAWYGPDLAKSEAWIYRLSASDIAEIEAAIAAIQQRGTQIIDVHRQDFSLPRLGPVLADIQQDVVNGRGFILLKGLPVDHYSIETAALAYWGIGTYFGEAVSQNAKGHLLGHVKDIGHDPHNPLHRVYATNYRQPFHTDSCDIVGLLCLKTAKSGGLSSLVSSVTIRNEMVKRRPDLATVLSQPFYVDRKGEVPAGKKDYYQMPVFNYYAGYLTVIYARDFIEAGQRFEEVPRLTPPQLEALDMLDTLAHSDEIRLDMALEPGDIQFLHNHQILHARTGYEDYPEPERKRHLLRLWLSPPNGRPLPPVFEERYCNIEVGRRGGIRVPGAAEQVVLEPE
jgi:hypothetical protein